MLIIGMSICIFFFKKYITDWYGFIRETMVTLLKYFDYGGILKKLLIKNIKYILFVAVICKSIYRKYLKYYLAVFWGISAVIPSADHSIFGRVQRRRRPAARLCGTASMILALPCWQARRRGLWPREPSPFWKTGLPPSVPVMQT